MYNNQHYYTYTNKLYCISLYHDNTMRPSRAMCALRGKEREREREK